MIHSLTRKSIAFVLSLLCAFAVSAQQTVIMPHQASDTIFLGPNDCYTILDPGGLGKYMHNEDSYLYIISNENFILDIDYETGYTDDGKDWIKVYYDTMTWYDYHYLCGTGQSTIGTWTNRALIHFHSNNYNSYEGFTIRLLHYSSIYLNTPVPVGSNSMNISWSDNQSSASSWTVYYACSDHQDSLHSVVTNTQSVLLTGLMRNTYYRYWVVNNNTSCVDVGNFKSYDDRWFHTQTGADTLLLPPNNETEIEPPYGHCYHLVAPTGMGSNSISHRDWMGAYYRFNDGHGVYVSGNVWLNYGDLYTEYYTPWNSTWGNWWYNNRNNYYQWLPDGRFRLFMYRRTKFDFQIVEENSRWLNPTVSSVSASSATITWTDSSQSTSWTVRYTSDDYNWQQTTTNTNSVTINGLAPGRQYVYTIEGNSSLSPCSMPARHGFITSGLTDTILMPYRGSGEATIHPGMCYTLMDAGGKSRYFRDDFSRMVVRTSNHKGFRIVGHCNFSDPDRLYVYDGRDWHDCAGDNYEIDISTFGDSAVFAFQCDNTDNRDGFSFTLQQVDTTIHSLSVTGITSTGATIGWADNSGATSWTLHYGLSEDNIQTVNTTTNHATLTGLIPGTQYVYWVTSQNTYATCSYSDRRGFITQGVPANVVLMPYRKTDTIYYTPGNCITILDGGGMDHHYFNRDSSELVILSTDNSNFRVEGTFVFTGNEGEYNMNSYDYNDRIGITDDPNGNWYNWYDGWWNTFNTSDKIAYDSYTGCVRLRFCSNGSITRPGYRFTVRPFHNDGVSNVKMTRVYKNSATVNWNDDGSNSWRVSWAPINANGTEGTASSAIVNVRNHTITGLQPETMYIVRVVPATTASTCGTGATTTFTTLPLDAIIMPHNSTDTVYISPGQCWYIFDAGGTGNYLPSDTSTLVVRSTTGEGFFYNFDAHVGEQDYSDAIWISDITGPNPLWWGWEGWHDSGEMTIQITSNEALQESGLWMLLRFPSTAYNPDTLNMTDSTVTIVWQDTSGATQWRFSYGPHVDSMTTVITSSKQYTMTGLSRNRQYFYNIYNINESPECVLENYYGVIMPCDPGVYITRYRNYYCNRSGRQTLYGTDYHTLPQSGCMTISDNGSFANMFRNCENNTVIESADGRGITIEGYYNLGNANISLYSYLPSYSIRTDTWYSNSGFLSVYSPGGKVEFYEHSGSTLQSMPPGFNFNIYLNYPLTNVRTQNLTCTSATLAWDDTSSATQWTIAYGPSEYQLDTVTVSTKSLPLSGLLPDQQYVCYLSSNLASPCLRPVKYAFVTTCDTTIFVLPYNHDTTRVFDIGQCYTILDPGAGNDYFFDDRIDVILSTPNTNTGMTLRGWAHCGPSDGLNIWNDVTGEWFGGFGNHDNINIFFKEGRAHLQWYSGGDTNASSGFELHASFHSIYDIHTTLKSDTTCRIEWKDNSAATQWTCFYGEDKTMMDSVVCNKPMAHLSNLVYGHRYYVFFKNNDVACLDTSWFEFCAGGDKCVEFGDIYSCFATSYYGRYNNPEEYKGMVNYGPDDINSRHTLVDDTTATDPRTGNMLRCVPPGYPESVRLGNWDIGGEAESIVYEYDVDTTKSEILVLRYAAVLENPGHSPSMQPRFRFSLVDENLNEIDPECYSADFISGSQLGWNTYQYDTNTVLWKDWTAVGIDLAPLNGQRIFVRLTTYDCNEMGHYGYAYFVLECQEKEVHPSQCGVVSNNTFTAPEGFRYRWYNIDSADVTLSTQRTFSSDQNGIYKCRASFLGSSGDNCYFEKTAVVGDIFPYANYEYSIVDTVDCDVIVQFYNRSCVTTDEDHQHPTSMECDDYVWDFGDGTTSSEKHPSHRFPVGHFDVTLTASLNGGECSDDNTKTILMRSPCIFFDTISPEICQGDTFALRDSLFVSVPQPPQHTTLNYSYVVRTEYRQDSIIETLVQLAVHPSIDTSLLGGICDGEAYTLFGFNHDVSGDYIHDLQSVYGCDSIYRLHLEVAHHYDTSFSYNVCDNVGYVYGDTVFTETVFFTDSLLSIYSCDSVVHIDIIVFPSYSNLHTVDICYGDSIVFGDTLFYTSAFSPALHSFNYVDSLLSVNACDSLELLTLNIRQVYDIYDTASFCRHSQYFYRGNGYDYPQTIVDSLMSAYMCDSVMHITIRYYDSTFAAHPYFSLDSMTWTEGIKVSSPTDDTVGLAGCWPLWVYMSDSCSLATQVPSVNHSWFFSDSNTTVTAYPNLKHRFADTGIFQIVHVVRSVDGCLDTAQISIQVLPPPYPDFSWEPDLITTLEPTARFINLSVPDRDSLAYLWFFFPSHDEDGDSPLDSSFLMNPQYTWPESLGELNGEKDVMLVAYRKQISIYGDTVVCTDTVTKAVDIVNIFLQFPNAVTPNGDGINDVWNIKNIEFMHYPVNRLRIYDRWGRLVFKRENIQDDRDYWDPNECDCPDGTYFFRFDALGEPGSIQRSGAIEVIGSSK